MAAKPVVRGLTAPQSGSALQLDMLQREVEIWQAVLQVL
jgi:hypothetical protein